MRLFMVAGWAFSDGLFVCGKLVDIEIFGGMTPKKLLRLKRRLQNV